MTKEYIEDFFEVAEIMYYAMIDEDKNVAFIGNYEEAVDVMKNVLLMDDENCLKVSMIDISDPDFGEYEGLYIIALSGDGYFWVNEVQKQDGELFNLKGEYDVVYTRPDYAKDVADKADDVCVVYFEGETVEESNRSLHLITDEEGKLKGFSFNDEGAGTCFNMELCSCGEIDADYLTNMIDRLLEAYTKR